MSEDRKDPWDGMDRDVAADPRHDSSRRAFLTAAGTVLAAAATGCRNDAVQAFLQGSVRELSRGEIKEMVARLERSYKREYGKDIHVSTTPAKEGVLFGYGLDLSRCVGCRRCVYACVKENNQSRPAEGAEHASQVHWIRVLEMEKEHGVDLSRGNAYYSPAEVPREGHFYIPTQCQQCENAPCVRACPVKATGKEPDGIVVVDYDWCIGCRYCMVACPYGARHFNWTEPSLPPEEINPNTHLLGNRPRPKGVVEKCTFCIQRVREGRYPACVEICPAGARKFGNLLDPESEIRYVIENKRVFILKEELNTQPKFFYFYGT